MVIPYVTDLVYITTLEGTFEVFVMDTSVRGSAGVIIAFRYFCGSLHNIGCFAELKCIKLHPPLVAKGWHYNTSRYHDITVHTYLTSVDYHAIRPKLASCVTSCNFVTHVYRLIVVFEPEYMVKLCLFARKQLNSFKVRCDVKKPIISSHVCCI